MKTIKRSIEIDPSKYVNIETGELLSGEKPGVSIRITEDTNLVEIQYKEYIMLDSATLDYIQENKILGSADMGHMLTLADTVKTEYNALYKGNNTVHSITSIATLLGLSYDKARLFIDRLIKRGIVYKFSGYRDGVAFKAYLMNPYVARKRKKVHKACVELFQQFK